MKEPLWGTEAPGQVLGDGSWSPNVTAVQSGPSLIGAETTDVGSSLGKKGTGRSLGWRRRVRGWTLIAART